MTGTFTTPQSSGALRDVTIAWSADTVGQGWGINAEMGGMRLYETMRDAGADVFIHTGTRFMPTGRWYRRSRSTTGASGATS